MKTRNLLFIALTTISLSTLISCTDDDLDIYETNELQGIEDGEITDDDI